MFRRRLLRQVAVFAREDGRGHQDEEREVRPAQQPERLENYFRLCVFLAVVELGYEGADEEAGVEDRMARRHSIPSERIQKLH